MTADATAPAVNAAERAEYMAIVVGVAASNAGSTQTPVKLANDAMYLWIAANKLAKGLER